MSLRVLPNDVLVTIARQLVSPYDFTSFARTDRGTWRLLMVEHAGVHWPMLDGYSERELRGTGTVYGQMLLVYFDDWTAIFRRRCPDRLQRATVITPELCLAFVKRHPLELVPVAFRSSAVCTVAMEQHPAAFSDVPKEVQTVDMGLRAVRYRGLLLRHASDAVRTPEVVFEAVQQCVDALDDVPESERTDELYALAVRKRIGVFYTMPDARKTPDLCRYVVLRDWTAMAKIPTHCITPELCNSIVRKDGMNLQFVPDAMRTLTLCRLAIKKKPSPFVYWPPRHCTPAICDEVVVREPRLIAFVPDACCTT